MSKNPSVSNQEFIDTVFGRYAHQAHVTGFADSPIDQSAPRSIWAGRWWSEGGAAMCAPNHNNFYVISTFAKDPHGRAVRTEPQLERTILLTMDDVGTGQGAKIKPDDVKIKPSFVVETSEDNYQYGYLFAEPFDGHAMATLAESRWREYVKALAGGKDPGSGQVTRYQRLPVGINNKPQYVVNGLPWTVRMTVWEPTRRYANEKFLKKVLGVTDQEYDDAKHGVHVPGTSAATSGATYTDPDKDTTGWGHVLNERGLLQKAHKPGAWDMQCPFIAHHTKQVDTGCAYLGDGVFKCHHGHCEDKPPSEFQDELEKQYPGIRADVAKYQFRDAPVPADIPGLDNASLWATVGYDPKVHVDQAYLEDRYVYVVHDDEVFDLYHRKSLTVGAFNRLYAGPVQEKLAADLLKWNDRGKPPMALDSLLRSSTFIRASAKEYAPGKPRWWKDIGRSTPSANYVVANTYAEPDLGKGTHPVRVRNITPALRHSTLKVFRELVEQITGEKGDKLGGMDWRMYNWISLMVADPAVKPTWQWLIMSDTGFGKDTLASIIAKLVGDENWIMVNSDAVSSSFTEWASKKFVIINELSPATEGRKRGISLFDHLKTYFTAPPATINVNPKYGRTFEAYNVAGYMIFSNHAFPLVIDKGERRLCVLDRLNARNAFSLADWDYVHQRILSNPLALEVIGLWLRERYANMSAGAFQELQGNAPATASKDKLRQTGYGKYDEMVLRWIEDPDSEGPLWTTGQLRDRLHREVQRDRSLGSMTMGVLISKLREHGAWKPFTHGERDGRVTGVGTGPRGRDAVWALYEEPGKGLTQDAELAQDAIRDMLIAQGTQPGSVVVPMTQKPSKKADKKDSGTDDG